MIRYFIKRHFGIKKSYKVTLSYLDKFTTNQEIDYILRQINQIDVVRVNKSTKKNYCHIDITSELDHEEIKVKLENFKVFGNKVKLRLKQLEKFDSINEEESEESLDIFSPEGLKYKILSFFKKNFMNFVGCKDIIGLFDKFDYEKNYVIKECETGFLEYEYKFVSHEDQKKIKLDNKPRKSIKHTSKFSIVPIKTFFCLKDTDEKSTDPEQNFSHNKESMEKIFLSTINILKKMDLSIYDEKKHIGVWRNLQVKILNSKIMINLMTSQMQLDHIDFKYLKEIMKAEYFDIPNVESVYLAVNDKTKASINNSSSYIYAGKKTFISEKLLEKNLEINVLPSFSDLNQYFNVIDLREIFDIPLNVFENVYDYSNEFFPQSIYFKNFLCKNLICLHTELAKEIPKIKTDSINEAQSFDVLSLNIVDKQIPTCFGSLWLKEEFEFNPSADNLVVINLRIIDKIKLSQNIKFCRYHVIYSESPYQILDFIKRYKESRLEIVKIIFLRNDEYEVKQFLFLIKILN